MSTNQELKAITAKAVMYLFALRLSDGIKDKNAHDQLYRSLKALGGDWHNPEEGENRRIQFVQVENTLACRSTTKPEGVSFLRIELAVTGGQEVDIRVRLPTVRRDRNKNGGRSCVAIPKENKVQFYTDILNRNGMETKGLMWTPAVSDTIFFSKKGVDVAVPVDDIRASVKITDELKFIEAMLHGVGRYKTYGCGMISIVDREV